jgi:hypothetical protein
LEVDEVRGIGAIALDNFFRNVEEFDALLDWIASRPAGGRRPIRVLSA